MCTRDVLLEFAKARSALGAKSRAFFVCAQILDVDQQIGQSAFDRFKMAEARVGGVQPFNQFGDPVFEMSQRDIVAARLLKLLDLVGHRLQQRLQARRQSIAVMRAFGQRAAERVNAKFELVKRVAGASAYRQAVDFSSKHLDLCGEAAHGLIRSDMRRHFAQCGYGALELLHRRRVFLGHDEIDLVGECLDCVRVSDQVFRRRQVAQRVAHFGEPIFDAC